MIFLKIGQHLIAHPRICGGRLTFLGTRIKVADVLEMLNSGTASAQVASNYPGLVSVEAIEEAATLVGNGVICEIEEAA
ncbi:MAG: DUF433 domain-containing protein [Candidatus Poribacteria bacterium]